MSAARLPITDTQGLRQALAEANLPTLLMVYVQYTQDSAYLERFAPCIRSMFSIEPTSIPEELAADLRERLFALLTRADPPQEAKLPREFVRRMMSVSVGEEVAAEQVPVLYDQMAFEKPVPRRELPNRKQPPRGFKVAVIGAGMGGIAAGVKLGEAGYDFTIIEKNADFGGTWLENVYPGVAVDTPSHFYSYSFEQNPDWSSYYPRGAEIEQYLLGVAQKYGLRDKVIFNTRVRLRLGHDEAIVARERERGRPRTGAGVQCHHQRPRRAEPLVDAGHPGPGGLQGPRHALGRLGSRGGPARQARGAGRHRRQRRAARDRDGAAGRAFDRVPALAALGDAQPRAAPRRHRGIRFALREIPHFKEWFRFRVYWFSGDGLYGNVLGDPDWPQQDVSISAQNHGAREYALAYMRECFADRPDLLEKMTPDYPIFGKRIVLDSAGGWLDTLKRPNVTLETRGIEHIEADAIVLKDGSRIEVDVIALATGFEVSPALGHLHVHGRGGKDLAAAWGKDDARSYLGIMVPEYPNLFLTLGPNSAPNHAAGVNMVIEAQLQYIIEALDLLVVSGARSIEPTQQAYADWNRRVEEQMKYMVWTHPKARSYYLASTGRNWVSSPFRLADYWAMTRTPDPAAMRLG